MAQKVFLRFKSRLTLTWALSWGLLSSDRPRNNDWSIHNIVEAPRGLDSSSVNLRILIFEFVMASLLLILLAALLLIGVILLAVLLHAGYLTNLRIRMSIPASLPSRVVYTVHKGPYQKAYGPLSELTARAPKQRAFCIFYDDPKKVRQFINLLKRSTKPTCHERTACGWVGAYIAHFCVVCTLVVNTTLLSE